MSTRRRWWGIYAACAAVVVAALVWTTWTVLRLERAESAARADAVRQETLRLALWRMDSDLAPELAREAARPYFDYAPFFAPRRAYTRLLAAIEPGDVLTPSPLLSFRSEILRIHFQVSPDGEVTSPQAPRANLRDLAEAGYLDGSRIDANRAVLDSVAAVLTGTDLASCVAESESAEPRIAVGERVHAQVPALDDSPPAEFQMLRNAQEWTTRRGTYEKTLEQAAERSQSTAPSLLDAGRPADVRVGTLVPIWLGDGGVRDPRLVFIRRVRVEDREYFQGFLCDWPVLRESLLSRIEDLVTGASLTPAPLASRDRRDTGSMLATIPAYLELPALSGVGPTVGSPSHTILASTWLGVLAGLIAVAVTLRSSIHFGERRSRFASAVTHELRTPLTTFQLYTDMLAGNMITDADQRREYLETLRTESGRLATLVENVLSYARLEEGRSPRRTEVLDVDSLVARVAAPLRRRAEEAEMALEVECDAGGNTRIETDVEAVGQILMNLVDNACKYARRPGEAGVRLVVEQRRRTLRLSVCDRGPGVSPSCARAIFAPFDRGANGQSDKPGIGLGLALARGLARHLGGDLALAGGHPSGACFVLTLPV